MCIKTRIKHWRATGLVVPAVVTAYAVLVFPFIDISAEARDVKVHAMFVAIAMLVAMLYALYFSPQARQVRKAIVEAEMTEKAGE